MSSFHVSPYRGQSRSVTRFSYFEISSSLSGVPVGSHPLPIAPSSSLLLHQFTFSPLVDIGHFAAIGPTGRSNHCLVKHCLHFRLNFLFTNSDLSISTMHLPLCSPSTSLPAPLFLYVVDPCYPKGCIHPHVD